MRKLALVLVLAACGGQPKTTQTTKTTATTKPTESVAAGATITVEDAAGGGREPLLKAAGDKLQAKLNEAAGRSAFEVHVTLSALDDKTDKINCKIKIVLTTRPQEESFGFLNGGATVAFDAAKGTKDQAVADCIGAVVEDLIEKKAIPTIKDHNTPASTKPTAAPAGT